MRRRVAGVALLVLGAALATLPAFAWYTAPPPGDPTRASGFAGAAQLWALPFLGALTALAGALLLAARPEGAPSVARVAGAVVAACGVAAFGLTLWAAVAPEVALTVGPPAGPARVPADVSLAAAAIVAPVVAAGVAFAGLALMAAGRRAADRRR